MFIHDIGRRPKIERKTGKIIDLEKPRKKKDNKTFINKNDNKASKKSVGKVIKPKIDAIQLKDTTNMIRSKDQSRKINTPRKIVITSTSLREAESKAMVFFKIKNQSFLQNTILEKGKRKYFGLLGPRKIKYEFKIKPLYKEIVSDYLKAFFANSPFDVDFQINEEGKKLIGNITGEDEKLFSANNGELLSSLEYLVRKHLSKLINIEKAFVIQINTTDFVNSHEKRLEVLAQKMRDKAIRRKSSVITDTMPPSDRYIVHQFLNNDPRVSTSSIGKGHYKRVKIYFER